MSAHNAPNPPRQLAIAEAMDERREGWLSARLRTKTGVDVHEGMTTHESRMARIRELIEQHHLAPVIAGRAAQDRKTITFAEAFERLYGERLQPPTPKKGNRT